MGMALSGVRVEWRGAGRSPARDRVVEVVDCTFAELTVGEICPDLFLW